MGIHDDLNIRTVINAEATLTRLGGSLMPPEVVSAMQNAGGQFVDMFELQRVVGQRLAELTNNEAAYVSSGAAAGLYLSALACGLSTDPSEGLSLHDRQRKEVLVYVSHENAYQPSIELAGAKLVEIDDRNGTTEQELQNAITDRTLAFFYFAGEHFAGTALPLERVVEIAHARNIPVVVDAAAQLPPVENLWRFTREIGVDLAIFSGGKGLSGPQSSGLIVGRPDLIEVCRAHGAPNQHRGRAMKVGKEEMAGLLAAVERYLELDHEEMSRRYEAMVRTVIDSVSEFPDVEASRDWPNEAGQPIPRAKVKLKSGGAQEVRDILWDGDPRIAVAVGEDESLLVNPQTLNPGEETLVAERLVAVLDERYGRDSG